MECFVLYYDKINLFFGSQSSLQDVDGLRNILPSKIYTGGVR